MVEYPHVAVESNISPLDGKGPDAMTAKAVTSFGGNSASVEVYWAEVENSEGDLIPTLMVYIDGQNNPEVMVTYIDELVFTGGGDDWPQRLRNGS